MPLHTRRILPTPIPINKPLRRSQRIADLGILSTASPPPDDTPARNTRSRVQERTITQEAILACMTTYNDITSRSLTPSNAARCTFPIEYSTPSSTWTQVNSSKCVTFSSTQNTKKFGENHIQLNLAASPKAFPASAKAPTPLYSSHTMKFHWTASRTSHMDASVQTFVPKRPTQIARDSPLDRKSVV